ncbi:MAG TPA: YiiX/YebB-like N1pC/P60 family cysteine hydrolase [Chthoniobacterales bacterium]|nr:YiiX/YebB-like N1pC/P60 family cysteine hydrolase [Chthoniobacterales bacterium]
MKPTRPFSCILFATLAATLGLLVHGQNPQAAPSSVAGFEVGEVPTTLKDGDIVFHDSGSEQSLAIKELTKSPYSHVAIYFSDTSGGYVYEAHDQVEKTSIAKWSKRPANATHSNHTLWKALRLKDHPDGLSSIEAEKIKALFTPKVMGIGYDKWFKWGDDTWPGDKLYCSELVWKAYKNGLNIEVGKKTTFRAFDFSSEKAKALAKERYGGIDHLPLDEIVVTPQAIYESGDLQLVPPLTER